MANQAAIDVAKAAYMAACQAAFPAYTFASESAYNLYFAQVAAIQAQYVAGDIDAELAAARATFNAAIQQALATQPNVNAQAPSALPTYIPNWSATTAYIDQVVAINNKFASQRRVLNDELNAAKARLDAALRIAGDAYQAAIRDAKLNLEAALGVASPPGVVGQPIN